MPSNTAGGELNQASGPNTDPKSIIHYRPHTDPRSSHQQIAALVRELAREREFQPVLDVGCAQGMLGAMMQGSGIEIDGVEPNSAWAEMARPMYRQVFATTIENAPLEDGRYRLIVCGDVLEHLPDPVATLMRLRRASSPDAKFIISLPNVAHVAIRLMLLFGQFPKMERGILDRTHLQFLTRKTATQMLAQAGLKVERFSVTGVPIDELWKHGEGKLLFRALVRAQHPFLSLLPGLFGYQLIFLSSASDAKTLSR
jgi:2-polyprenyl-3-methyl-5-hydroxy-6-metoxy-1,4-benzoquinol methylase